MRRSMSASVRNFVTFFLIALSPVFVYSQDSVRVVEIDTLSTVSVGLYGSLDVKTSSHYIRNFNYAEILNSSSGVSIFNALRGTVPGLTIPAYFDLANASGLRTGSFTFAYDALLVIDGLPFNNEIGGYLNLNAFDYSSIAAFSNTSALNFLGGANSGAFVLTSKSGKDVTRPQFEFNSYSTYGWEKITNPLNGQNVDVSEWNLTNSLAYSQDFGKIDTRISYTLQKKFYQDFGEPFKHYLKVNTGLAASSKFDLRFIVDGRYSSYEDLIPPASSSTSTESKVETYISGNLMAKYKLSESFFFTSQVGAGSFHSSKAITSQSYGNESNTSNGFTQANLLINGLKRIGNVNLSGFVGYQLYTQSIENTGSGFGSSTWVDNYPYFLGQASLTVDDRFGLSAHFRNGTHDGDNGDNHASAGSVGASLLFGDWIGLPILSLGKVRASIGSHTVVLQGSYPNPDNQRQVFPSSQAYDVNNLEAGLDLGFSSSRITTTLNYYQNVENYFPYNPTNGNSITKYSTSGYEADLRYEALRTDVTQFQSGIIISNSTSIIDIDGVSQPESKPYFRLGWLNSMKFRSLQMSFLVESVKNFTGYASNTGFVDASFTVLRDISLSVKLPVTTLFGLETSSMTLSVVGRNLTKFGGTGPDVDYASGLSIFRKSASISLNLTF
jgi:hypothetical protein